ncbi:MAG: penicillin-binding protein 2 [Pseudomonadota bacterium]
MTDFAAPIRRRLGPRAGAPAAAAAGPGAPGMPSRDDWRLFLVILAFAIFYAVLGLRMGGMALSDGDGGGRGAGAEATPPRAAIVDREGRLLAANLPAYGLYAHPRLVLDPTASATALARLFPAEGGDDGLTAAEAHALLTHEDGFVWVRRPISPRQRDAVMDIGEPGLMFAPRDLRIYPAGRTAAHLMGRVKAVEEGVHFTTFRGAGGVEGHFDGRLAARDTADNGDGSVSQPLALSIDLSAQHALTEVLRAEQRRLGAIGAVGVLMRVDTGEILSLVSLPDFDANDRRAPKALRPDRSPRFNRGVQGLYELGSVFKPLTAAMALDLDLVTPGTLLDTKTDVTVPGITVTDRYSFPDLMTVHDVIARSSNRGTARLAQLVSTPRMQDYLAALGMFERLPLELTEASGSAPLRPRPWKELSTMTISYGHGISVSPVHLAAAYATLANRGRRVIPSIVKGGNPHHPDRGRRVFGERAARDVVLMLRGTVAWKRGTGVRAEVPGYGVAGKTGTAEKLLPDRSGYDHRRVISSFASVFPYDEPAYVLVVTMDEPTDRSGSKPSRGAGRTAAPAAGAAVARLAPILGLRPDPARDVPPDAPPRPKR